MINPGTQKNGVSAPPALGAEFMPRELWKKATEVRTETNTIAGLTIIAADAWRRKLPRADPRPATSSNLGSTPVVYSFMIVDENRRVSVLTKNREGPVGECSGDISTVKNRIPSMTCLRVDIVDFSDESFPGFVHCDFTDAKGNRHTVLEKIPVVTTESLWNESTYPQPGMLPCERVECLRDDAGRARPCFHKSNRSGLPDTIHRA